MATALARHLLTEHTFRPEWARYGAGYGRDFRFTADEATLARLHRMAHRDLNAAWWAGDNTEGTEHEQRVIDPDHAL
jgi:hypothetical protein